MSSGSVIVPLTLSALPVRPLVSVLIASYNYAAYVGEALDSLLAQSYGDFEAIVCDDGSTDASPDIVADYARRDGRIRLLTRENGGVASALNRAYAAAHGDVIVLLDADDVFAPEKLERVVACLRSRADVGMALHAMHVIDGRGRKTGALPFGGAFEEGWLAERVHARGGRWRSMPASALAFHRDVAAHLFPIPEATFRSEADGFLSTLAPLLTRVAFLPDALARYRLHGGNLTGAAHFSKTVLQRGSDALRRKEEAVNRRLKGMGLAQYTLSLDDNVNYHEQAFMTALLEGTARRTLLRSYGRLARALLADDLYRPLRKGAGLVAYGAAVALPVAARKAWLDAVLGARGFRRVLRHE